MKPKTKKWKPGELLNTPFKRAMQEWDNRMGNVVVQAKNWRLALFSTYLFIVFPLIIVAGFLGAQPKQTPHIVEVFPDGSAIYRGAVGKAWELYKPEKQQVTFQLQRFLEYTRNISSDMAVVKKQWFEAYNLLTPKAASTLSTYANDNNPFERAKTERISIDITAKVPLSADSWQCDWKETIWGPKGNVLGTEFWRATLKVAVIKPKSDQDLIKNPLGIYIDEFHWSRINR